MQKREKIILILVFIAAVYGIIDFTMASQKKKAASLLNKKDNQSVVDLTAQLSALTSADDKTYDRLAAAMTEPWPEQLFVPGQTYFGAEKKVDEKVEAAVGSLRAKAEQLVYSGFLAMGDERLAIIDGMDYRIGDVIDGFTITKISQNTVQVSQQDTLFDIPAITEQAPALSAPKAPALEKN